MTIYGVFSKWSQTSLVLRILVGLIIGASLGLLVPQWTGIGILGIVFVGALKAIAPILVAVLVAASIAKAGGGLGSRFRVLIFCYLFSTFIAAMCAVIGSFLFPVTLQLRDVVGISAPGALTDVFTNLLTCCSWVVCWPMPLSLIRLSPSSCFDAIPIRCCLPV